MGPFEEKIREALEGFCSPKLLEKKVEELMEGHCNIYALYTMSELMAAQHMASEVAKTRKTERFQYYQGKILACQELFVKVAFDGLSLEDGTVTEEMLRQATEFWQQKVHDVSQTLQQK